MQMGNLIIEPWSKKNCIYRIIAIFLVLLWLTWGLVLFQEGNRLQERLTELQLENQRKEEMQRREAMYRRAAMGNQTAQSGVQNVVDTLGR